jgi:DNA invertase Pin-like site-specific DNA recombinase
MKLTIGYLRASTNEQKQDVEHQKRSIEKYAKANNMKVDKWYSEYISAFSTSIDDREQINEIKKLAEENKVENLLIFESSRLARNMEDGLNVLDFFSMHNVRVFSVKDGKCINKEQIDKLFNAIQMYFNEQASRDTSARVKSAKRLAKEQGLWLGGKIPYGFTIEDKRLVVDKEKEPIVKTLYSTYITHGCKEAINYLSDYTDMYNINQTLLQYMAKPIMVQIVGQDVYDEFMTIKSSRNNEGTVRTNKSNVKLEGLLFHECGGKLSIDYNRGKLVFRCRKCKLNKSVSVKKSFSGDRLTANIESKIVELLNGLDKDKLLDKYNKESNSKITLLKMQIERTEKALIQKKKELVKAQTNIQKLLVSDVDINVIEISSGIAKQMESLIEQLTVDLDMKKKKLVAEQLRTDKQEDLVDSLLDFKYLYEKGNVEQQKIILNQLIEKVVVRDTDDFDIYLNLTEGSISLLPRQI